MEFLNGNKKCHKKRKPIYVSFLRPIHPYRLKSGKLNFLFNFIFLYSVRKYSDTYITKIWATKLGYNIAPCSHIRGGAVHGTWHGVQRALDVIGKKIYFSFR